MGMVAQPLLKFFYNNIYNLRDTYILIPFMPKDQFQATYFLGHKYTVYGKWKHWRRQIATHRHAAWVIHFSCRLWCRKIEWRLHSVAHGDEILPQLFRYNCALLRHHGVLHTRWPPSFNKKLHNHDAKNKTGWGGSHI